MTREIRVDAHVDATNGVLLLSSKQVPGFVRRVVLRTGRKNDLPKMMRIFRAAAEAESVRRSS
jgi:hypothetical protein